MTVSNIDKQISDSLNELRFALRHFEYSKGKVQALGLPDIEDLEALETWESFTSRFLRLNEVFLKKVLRSLIYQGDPAFRGSLMDSLNQGEKLGILTDASRWWAVRALRNKEAHEYDRNEILPFFRAVLKEADFVVDETKRLLERYASH